MKDNNHQETKEKLSDKSIADEVMDLYNEARPSHAEYLKIVERNSKFFYGDGGQWDEEVIKDLCNVNVLPVEINKVMATILPLVGYAINNRMSLTAYPIGDDQDLSELVTKLLQHILKKNKYNQKELTVILDGLIKQRGYFDVRMDFSNNALGDVKIDTLDPISVIPDVNATEYDPDAWNWVMVKRWLTYDEIELMYSKEKAEYIKQTAETLQVDDLAMPTNFRGNDKTYINLSVGNKYLIYELQKKCYEKMSCAVFPTGEVHPLTKADKDSSSRIEGYIRAGASIEERKAMVIKWYRVAGDTLLHHTISPYRHFTIVPYFPLFLRGKTISPIDNLISPQKVLNKMATNLLHHINTVVNAGWFVEENSLTNTTTEDLAVYGAKSKQVIEYRQGANKPDRLNPPPIPQGYAQLLGIMDSAITDISNVDESMRGAETADTSGVAVQSRQYFSLQNQAIYIYSMEITRELLGNRINSLVREYYDSHRVFRVTEKDPKTGVNKSTRIELNVPDGGGYTNDITVGEYDVEITTQPSQQTFENNQFTQALELAKQGVNIPPHIIVKHSNLTDKEEIIKAMTEEKKDLMKEAVQRLKHAQADKFEAEKEKTIAEAVNKRVEGIFSAVQAAVQASQYQQATPIADEMLKSAGFQDRNNNNVVAENNIESVPYGTDLGENNNPLTPVNPAVGLKQGIEGGSE